MVAKTTNEPARSEMTNESISELTRRLYYTSDVQYIGETYACDATLFDLSELGQMYWLDTSTCVLGKRKKKYNPMNLYEIFASYMNKTSVEIEELVLKEISENTHWYRHAGHVCLGMRGMTFDEWLKQLKYKRTPGDELCVYALSALLRRHTIIHNAVQLWFSLKRTPRMSFSVACELSETLSMIHLDIVLLDEIQYTRELYRDHLVPEMYITIKRGFGEKEKSSMTDDPITSSCDSTNPGQPVVKQEKEKVSGVIHLDIFDENYIDWLKCEPKIRVEQSLIVKTEESSVAQNDKDATKNEVIQDVRSLSEHSPSCQLRIALENANMVQSPDKVMQCCANDTTLDVATITPNEVIVFANTMHDAYDKPGLERPLVHMLPVATDESSALNVATSGQDYQVNTADHDTLLSVAMSNQPSLNVIGNCALNVATEMIINTEPLHVPMPSINKEASWLHAKLFSFILCVFI